MSEVERPNGRADAPPILTEPATRANPMVWPDEPNAEGVFVGDADELTLLGQPASSPMTATPRLPADFRPNDALVAFFKAIQTALERAAETARAGAIESARFDLAPLDAESRQAVGEILLNGEVSGVLGADPLWQIQEAVTPGVWRVRAETAAGAVLEDYIEIGDAPALVRDHAALQGGAMAPLPARLPKGVMNAAAVLEEIRAKSESWTPGQPNHVLNFTLLPLTEADQELITGLLGQTPIKLVSGGFGTCRILATAVKNVWAVQFLSAMGLTILDTVEVGDVPEAAKAGPEDFEDSAERIGEIMEAYLS